MLQHRDLALGGAAAVAAHCRKHERTRAEVFQPLHRRADDRVDVRDAATVSPGLMRSAASPRVAATARGMSWTRGRGNVWRTRIIRGNAIGASSDHRDTGPGPGSQRIFPLEMCYILGPRWSGRSSPFSF